MAEVPIHGTPLSKAQAQAVLEQAWLNRHGGHVHPLVLRNLLALWDLETAQGARMWNNNWGNLVLRSGRAGDFFVADDSGNSRHFIAYPDALSGADDFIRELLDKDNWRRGLLTGRPDAFAKGLKGPPAYYEASLDRYTRTLVSRWNNYSHLTQPPRAGSERTHPGQKRPSNGVFLLAAAAIVGVTAYASLRR